MVEFNKDPYMAKLVSGFKGFVYDKTNNTIKLNQFWAIEHLSDEDKKNIEYKNNGKQDKRDKKYDKYDKFTKSSRSNKK